MRKIIVLSLFSLIAQISAETCTIKTEGYQRSGALDCPSGLTADGGECSILAAEQASTSSFQFQSGAVIGLRTQMLDYPSRPTSEAAINSKPELGSADNNRYVKITVELDNSAGDAEYTDCSAALITSDLKDIVDIVGGSASSDVGDPKKPSCSFYLSNHKFLGSVNMELTFNKDTTTIAGGESTATKVRVPFAFGSHTNDPEFGSLQNVNLRDLAISYADGCVSPGGYLLRDKSDGTDCNDGQSARLPVNQDKLLAASTAAGGKISLRLTGVFLDTRYKVLSQSGAEKLPASQGDFLVVKQGLALHADYMSFNDPSLDKSDNGGDGSINLSPIDFPNYKDINSVVTHEVQAEGSGSIDFSNKGQPLDGQGQAQRQQYVDVTEDSFGAEGLADKADAYGCVADAANAGAAGECHSQYLLSTTVDFEYGTLPHFQPSYIGCDVCDSELSIKGLVEDVNGADVYRINTLLSMSALDLPSATADFSFKAVKLTAKKPEQLLQPGVDYKISTLFSLSQSTHDLQLAAGGTLTSLDDAIKFDEYLAVSSLAPDGGSADNAMELEAGKCGSLKDLQLKDLQTDILAGYSKIFDEDCTIAVPTNYYGTKHTLTYTDDQTGDGAVATDVIEIDSRTISLVNPDDNSAVSLSLTERARAYVSRVATTIAMDFVKVLPDTAIPASQEFTSGEKLKDQKIIFRLAGDSNSMAGHVSTATGGAECAGNNMYWKSTERAKRIYAATGAEKVSPAAWESGLPYGTCDGSSLSDVLTQAEAATGCSGKSGTPIAAANSVLRDDRCLGGTGYSEGQLVLYKDCKNAGGRWTIVSVPDATYTTDNGDPATLTCTSSSQVCDSSVSCSAGCTTAVDQLGFSSTCAEPAVQEEVLFTTSTVNGQKKRHGITSTGDCTGTLDFQLEDQTLYNEFAIYKARIDCSRVSTELLSDTVKIKYQYVPTLDLETDTWAITAKHSDNVRGSNRQGFCVTTDKASTFADCGCCSADGSACEASQVAEGECLSPKTWLKDFNDEYSVSAQIGKCGAGNVFKSDYIYNSGDCDNSFVTASGANADTQLVLDTSKSGAVGDGLESLIQCAQDGGVTSDGDTYVISYDVAMQYVRTPVASDAFSEEINFCEDQTFTATINRAATATVTASSIQAAGLKRAVIVKDIGWTGDGDGYSGCDAGEYRLEVLLAAKDADDRDANPQWENAKLTRALLDTAAAAENPNNLIIHSGADGRTIISGTTEITGDAEDTFVDHTAATGHLFKVRGGCIAITECLLTDSADLQNGDSWKDFSSSFNTDLVVRGTFLETPVDTMIKMTLDFQECPVDGETAVTGSVRVGLTTSCNDAQNAGAKTGTASDADRIFSQSIAQPTTGAHLVKDPVSNIVPSSDPTGGLKYDCTEAFADDVLRVEGFSFVTKDGCSETASDAALTDEERTAAGDIPYSADCGLFQTEFNMAASQQWNADEVDVYVDRYDTSGAEPTLVTETQVCACSSASCAVSASPDIPGLSTFPRADGTSAFKQYLACGAHGAENGSGDPEVMPAASSETGTDLFKHQIPLLPLGDASADQFVLRYEVVLKSGLDSRRLRATIPFRKTTKLNAKTASAEGNAHGIRVISLDNDAGATDLADGDHDHDDGHGDHTHDNDHDHDAGMVALIVILSVLGAGIIGFAIYYFACRDRREDGDESERKSLVENRGNSGYRTQRFKNLRY